MSNKTIWILIADGAQARVLEYQGPGGGLALVEGMVFSQEPLDNKDIMSDRPGRSFSSAGTGRSAMAYPTDPVQHREAAFMAEMADMLEAALQEGAYDELILAAAPRALGDLRKALPASVQKCVTAELDKDLTNIPSDKLEKHFEGVLKL
jgi:protein required for attachment to host cells